MDIKRLIDLVALIRENRYDAQNVKDFERFKNMIANDLLIDKNEAMALLGYLLKRGYVKIDDKQGITIDNQNSEMKKIVGLIDSVKKTVERVSC
jgi:hypothetical protein